MEELSLALQTLIGCVGSNIVNYGYVSIVLSASATCYLLRGDANWNVFDLTGWTLSAAGAFFTGYGSNGLVYQRALAPGTYSFNTNSAMYACSRP